MPDFNQPQQGKAVGEMPAPVKPAPVKPQSPSPTPAFEQRVPQQPAPIKAAPSAPPLQPQVGGMDEFGRPLANMAGYGLGAVPDFNQRKAHAMQFSYGGQPPPLQPMPGQLPPTGGGFLAPPPGARTQPPQAGGLWEGPQSTGMQPTQREMGGGVGGGGGMQPPPGFQQLMQQPGFMQWLMKMFQSQQQPGMGGMQAPGQPPQPQFQPANQGPPR